VSYYDTEWGLPVHDEAGLFERMSLDGFQAGLSWLTILKKRERVREACAGLDAETVAGYGEAEIDRLLADAGLIGDRGEIAACVTNAARVLGLRDEGGLGRFIWFVRPADTPRPRTVAEILTAGPGSAALWRALERRGFRFVGLTTMYALREAIGMV